MKNVTITLDEKVAAWARVEAAKDGKSLSRFVSDMLAERRARTGSQHDAMTRFLQAPDFPGVTADRPTREELYAERVFHRHERPALREGPAEPRQARKGARVARGTRK